MPLTSAATLKSWGEIHDRLLPWRGAHSRREGRSWEIREHFFHIFASQDRCAVWGLESRQASEGAHDNSCLARALASRGQNNVCTVDTCFQSVAGTKIELAPKGRREHNLAFAGNPGFHGKTILPHQVQKPAAKPSVAQSFDPSRPAPRSADGRLPQPRRRRGCVRRFR